MVRVTTRPKPLGVAGARPAEAVIARFPAPPGVRVAAGLLGRRVALRRAAVGQEPFRASTVFGFYSPEYRPAGAVAQSRQLSPEAEVTSQSDHYIAKLNGFFSKALAI